uniref:Tyrosine-protein phosphatase domain-containing protein n=1 Tax=Haemonchus contortus TaxID=6289 RepID=A0A7I4Y2N8_HAECO
MISRTRLLNRSDTGPVPLECTVGIRTYGRSSSASSASGSGRVPNTRCCTPVMLVKPKKPQPQSQSMDSGLVSLPSPVQPMSSMNPILCSSGMLQVHEFIFLGNAEIASKVQQSSEHNIRYFVNISVNNSSLMRSSHSWNCLDEAAQQAKSSVVIPYREDMPAKELFEMFNIVNDIIRQARNKAQRVLIFSENGLVVCLVFALAYNIHYYNLDLDRALCNFKRLKIFIEVDDFSKVILSKWATYCEEKRVREMAILRREQWKEARPASVDCATRRVAWQ